MILFQFFPKKQTPVLIVCLRNVVANKSVSLIKEREAVLPINKYVLRTHTCGELTHKNLGENVKLNGWMEFQRMGKFITLRDSYGSTQLLVPEDVCK